MRGLAFFSALTETKVRSGPPADHRENPTLIEVEHVSKAFPILGGPLRRRVGEVQAVVDVSFTIQKGEVLSVVGESGCGKTTLGRTILYLQRPTSGRVIFDGLDLSRLTPEQLRHQRGQMQIVFQDPQSSLNPRMPVYDLIGEGLLAQGIVNRQERIDRIVDSLAAAGLRSDSLHKYPHEFSGGQRQRIGIARALALQPRFIVCDEALSALDVSVQSQILNLLTELQATRGLTYLFIAHNLAVVRHISDRVAVMYLGRIVELAPAHDLYESPMHPYTVALISAMLHLDHRRRRQRIVLQGDVPSPMNRPPGCPFQSRCWLRQRLGNPMVCATDVPPLIQVRPRHHAACHFTNELSGQPALPERARL